MIFCTEMCAELKLNFESTSKDGSLSVCVCVKGTDSCSVLNVWRTALDLDLQNQPWLVFFFVAAPFLVRLSYMFQVNDKFVSM